MGCDHKNGNEHNFVNRELVSRFFSSKTRLEHFWEQKPPNGRPMKTYEESLDRFEQINEFA